MGAGIGGGFAHTTELIPMKYKEAMSGPDAEAWAEECDKEHDRMLKNKVFKAIKRTELDTHAKVIDSTWALKKKTNGKLRGRVVVRGFKQIEGEHFDNSNIHAPVANGITIRIVFTIMIMGRLEAEVVDVDGAFLHGEFEPGERVYIKIPEGWEKFYDKDEVLLLCKTLYGTRQAAMAFWKKLCEAMEFIGQKRSKADPCLYYSWTQHGLVLIVSWIDDNLIVGTKAGIAEVKSKFMKCFDCTECGDLDEYVGLKLERDEEGVCGGLKMYQPVLLQSLKDEFEINPEARRWASPAEAGSILFKTDDDTQLSNPDQTYVRKGVGKLMHLQGWSRPDLAHRTRELAKHMNDGRESAIPAMHRLMEYAIQRAERGWTLRPDQAWDGSKDFEFEIRGRSDTDYAKDPETRHSVTGTRVSLCGAAVGTRSAGQRYVTLSVCESEQGGMVTCAQDMIFCKHVVESVELKVKLPMILESDNEGAVDLANNWSSGGRTRHVDVRQNFLRELKEKGILKIVWIPGPENDADMHTKNLGGPELEKHARVYFGKDKYN